MKNRGIKVTKLIKKTPIPIAGLMLALAATGNLVESYGKIYKNIFGIISAGILLLLVSKIIIDSKAVLEGLKNPVIASVSPTFSMGIMILATYVKPSSPSLAYGMWILGLLIHAVLIIYFTKEFLFNFNIKKVFPSYFVVYVGIVVGSVTAPAFNSLSIGKPLFWFGFISYLLLLPIVLYRVFKIKGIPEPAIPTITIFAAPASLCLAGYMSSFSEKNMMLVGLLTALSLIMLIGVLLYMNKMLRLRFYPSYAAFTFPLVISAIAIKKTNGFLMSTNSGIGVLKNIVLIEEFLAVTIVVYVLARFISFFIKPVNNKEIKMEKPVI